MPLYDYRCPNCETRFEAQHRINEEPPPCPKCGHSSVQRIITTAPSVAGGILTHAGNARGATKEQLKDKWREETPKLRSNLVDKLGEDMVRKNAPHLFNNDE